MIETERINGLLYYHVTLSRCSCVSMWLNFQLTLYTEPLSVSDDVLFCFKVSFKGNILGPVSAVSQFLSLPADSSVAKQRHQVAVIEWQLVSFCLSRADTNVLQPEWFCKQRFFWATANCKICLSGSCCFLMREEVSFPYSVVIDSAIPTVHCISQQ